MAASMLAVQGLGLALPARQQLRARAAAAAPKAPKARTACVVRAAKVEAGEVVRRAAAPVSAFAALAASSPALAAQELGQLANEVNILGVMAVALFIMVPVSFLLILYIKSSSEGNQSGGFSQEYYDASYKRGDKKAK